VGGGRAVRAAARRHVPQEADEAARTSRRADAGVSHDAGRGHARALDHGRRDPRPLCRGAAGSALGEAAVLPAVGSPDLLVNLRLPQNASIYAGEAATTRLDDLLRHDPDVAHWSTYVGRGAIRFHLSVDVELPNDFFSQAVVIAKDLAARDRLQKRLETELAT
jgi:hypothetical protein